MKQKKLLIIFIVIIFSIRLNAQNLIVQLKNSTVESFSISDIKNIKFEYGSMILSEKNGTKTSFSIFDIDNYHFNNITELNSQLMLKINNLILFPNPTSNLLNIKFHSTLNTFITIDIMDVNGKIIQQVYQGNHEGERIYQWYNELPKGNYYCRIITDNKIISKPITLQ
jgi:hypothetical protein